MGMRVVSSNGPLVGALGYDGILPPIGQSSAYPNPNNGDSGVVALWLLDEASGNIVDEINSITCAVVGTPTFNVSASGLWANHSPGITYATGNAHRKTTATTALDIASLASMVFEAVFTITDSAGLNYLMSYNSQGSNTDFGILCFINVATTLTFRVRSDDLTNVTGSWTISDLNDGNIHKIRVAVNFAGNGTLYVDGVSQGTVDFSSLSGKALTNNGYWVCGQFNAGGANLNGTCYTHRLTVGNVSANFGGPNGG